jgi:hypothetical protein
MTHGETDGPERGHDVIVIIIVTQPHRHSVIARWLLSWQQQWLGFVVHPKNIFEEFFSFYF